MCVVLGHSGGVTISGVRKQTDQVVTVKPAPDVVLIQVVDNDVRCDGTDLENCTAFGTALGATLTANR